MPLFAAAAFAVSVCACAPPMVADAIPTPAKPKAMPRGPNSIAMMPLVDFDNRSQLGAG
jgi:hypothetical protein